MRIAEYKQVSTEYTSKVEIIDVMDENGEIHQEEREVAIAKPVMGMVYRDATPEELEEAERMQREMEEAEANREPTVEERMEAQVMYTALMTDTLLMEDDDDV